VWHSSYKRILQEHAPGRSACSNAAQRSAEMLCTHFPRGRAGLLMAGRLHVGVASAADYAINVAHDPCEHAIPPLSKPVQAARNDLKGLADALIMVVTIRACFKVAASTAGRTLSAFVTLEASVVQSLRQPTEGSKDML